MEKELIALFLVIGISIIFFALKRIKTFIINSILGLLALLGLNLIGINIAINIINILIVAIGGILGIIVLLIFHFL